MLPPFAVAVAIRLALPGRPGLVDVRYVDLARELEASASWVHTAVKRLRAVGIIVDGSVRRDRLLAFVAHGMPVAYLREPGEPLWPGAPVAARRDPALRQALDAVDDVFAGREYAVARLESSISP